MTKAEKELIDIDTVFTALAHPSRREVLMVLKLRDGAMIAGNRGIGFSCSGRQQQNIFVS
jgi:hypothetical protein